ncbi:putative reverse transcriptase domain-containing protein [Tanacetum coccineum]
MESVQDMSGCGDNQKVKYTAGSFIEEFSLNNEMQKLETEFWCHALVEAVHAAYTDRIHELARLVPYLVIPENKRIERYIYGLAPQIPVMVAAMVPITIQSVVLKAGMLTDEAIRNGSLKKNTEKRGNSGEPSRYGNARDDNKRSRITRVFAIVTNPVRKEYMGTAPKCTNCNYHHLPEVPCRMYTNCNCFGHFAKDCRVGPMMVNLLNDRNPIAAREACFECGSTDHYKAACPSYEIEIASGQLVEINKIIRGCKLEIAGHTFDIDLIPFRHGSFDVIVGMDWLSRNKAVIVFHEKVVRIPLPNSKMLRVLGERTKDKVRHLMSAKAGDQKLKDIFVIRNFFEVIMDYPNITIEDYIRLEDEKALRRGTVYNWETAKYGKIWYDEDVHDLRSVETKFPAIVFNDALTSEVMPSCGPSVSPLNDN